MAIIGLQRRIREVGRIRLGVQVETDNGGRRPRKLATPRFTSADRTVIEACAELFGGEVNQWDNNGSTEYEVIVKTNEIPVLVPPNPAELAFSQFYEQWAKGFCTRRCDGEWDTIKDEACVCDPDNRECKATTRLSVLVPAVPGFGTWRVESHGYYAAVELGAALELIERIAPHALMPARLRLDRREVRRLVKGKAEVRKFVVPILDLDVSVNDLRTQLAGSPTPAGLPAGNGAPTSPAPAGWQPVPEVAPPVQPSIESQLEAASAERANRPARKNAAKPLPRTGRAPRTAVQRQRDDKTAANVTDTCPHCAKPYGAEGLVPNRNRAALESGAVPRFVHKACHDALDAHPAEEPGGPASEPAGPVLDAGAANHIEDRPREGDEPAEVHPDDAAPGTWEPPPLDTGAVKMPTAKMHSKIFALLAETMPVDVGTTGATADERRRIYELRLCDAIGAPGLSSHKEITFETGRLLIDALEGIKAGTWALGEDEGDQAVLINAETGELIDWTEQEGPF